MNLFKLSNKNLWNELDSLSGEKNGIYKLRWVKNKKPQSINRLFGTDNKGLLYIGKADLFTDRVIDLKKTLSPDYESSPHSCGRKINEIEILRKNIHFEDLYVEIIPDNFPEKREGEELKKYTKTFGEVPPLNAIG